MQMLSVRKNGVEGLVPFTPSLQTGQDLHLHFAI
jgi:hypothetical protein